VNEVIYDTQQTEAAVRGWFEELQSCVRAVDFGRAERIFAPDVVGFGTYKDIAEGRETLRREQWSNIWPNISEFTFTLEQLRWGAAGDRAADGSHLAWAACPWTSVGFGPDGTRFDRPGRVTVVLERRGGEWLAIHTHFSLYPRPAVT
jgi:ketosteroid isomerase-like protein